MYQFFLATHLDATATLAALAATGALAGPTAGGSASTTAPLLAATAGPLTPTTSGGAGGTALALASTGTLPIATAAGGSASTGTPATLGVAGSIPTASAAGAAAVVVTTVTAAGALPGAAAGAGTTAQGGLLLSAGNLLVATATAPAGDTGTATVEVLVATGSILTATCSGAGAATPGVLPAAVDLPAVTAPAGDTGTATVEVLVATGSILATAGSGSGVVGVAVLSIGAGLPAATGPGAGVVEPGVLTTAAGLLAAAALARDPDRALVVPLAAIGAVLAPADVSGTATALAATFAVSARLWSVAFASALLDIGAVDQAILDDVVTRLAETGEFAGILANAPEGSAGSDPWPLVTILDPGTSEDIPLDTSTIEHRGALLITITIPESYPGEQYANVSRLEQVIRRTLDGRSLARATLPAWTRVGRELTRRASFAMAGAGGTFKPELDIRRSFLVLNFAYDVPAVAGVPAS